jgi:hypothetical protein
MPPHIAAVSSARVLAAAPRPSTCAGILDFFERAPPPRDDLSHMLERIALKALAMVLRRGLLEEQREALASAQAEAVLKGCAAVADSVDPAGWLSASIPPISSRESEIDQASDELLPESLGRPGIYAAGKRCLLADAPLSEDEGEVRRARSGVFPFGVLQGLFEAPAALQDCLQVERFEKIPLERSELTRDLG